MSGLLSLIAIENTGTIILPFTVLSPLQELLITDPPITVAKDRLIALETSLQAGMCTATEVRDEAQARAGSIPLTDLPETSRKRLTALRAAGLRQSPNGEACLPPFLPNSD